MARCVVIVSVVTPSAEVCRHSYHVAHRVIVLFTVHMKCRLRLGSSLWSVRRKSLWSVHWG
eukprot:16235-Amphidinium_carterae.1